ncbi:hypothetical protein [Nocardia cyriacigeorgica]|uniref:hypothetical protein n=1 Tax=Nocardia cyriacigeorgica TaxID=135487 RepID=UPI0024564986|nr:hypothetical protein [Nocardia cyriacigeorgica]
MEHAPHGQVDDVMHNRSEFRSAWKCWSITALSLLTLVLLFQPWLSASGPHGDVQTDAFGRMDGSVPALRIFGEPVVSINGLWGMLIGVTAIAALFGAQLHRIIGVGRSLAIGASTANAVLVPLTLLYLNGKAPELEEMTKDHDELKETLGNFLKSVFGGSTQPAAAETAKTAATAALTNQALICGLVVALTAAIAVSIRNRPRPAADTGSQEELSDPSTADAAPIHVDDAADVMERKLEHILQHKYHLIEPAEVEDDEHGLAHEVGQQRLLPRSERPHRSDGQTSRQTRRRPRPRPANPTTEKSQVTPWVAASQSGRLATPSRISSTALAERQRSHR